MALPLPTTEPAVPAAPASAGEDDRRRAQYQEVKGNIERQLLSRLNLETLASTPREQAEGEIRAVVLSLITESGVEISNDERDAIIGDVLDEVFGLGPLEPLLRDKTVNDVLVNTWQHVFVERKGKLERVPGAFQDDKHLMRVIDRIVSGVGRRIDETSPMRGWPMARVSMPSSSRWPSTVHCSRSVAFQLNASRPGIWST